jgi:hypothetical protein
MFEIEPKESIEQIWLFSRVKYLLGTGSFTITLNPLASQYFFELKNKLYSSTIEISFKLYF